MTNETSAGAGLGSPLVEARAAARSGGPQPHELEALHVLLEHNGNILTDGDGNLWCVVIPEGARS